MDCILIADAPMKANDKLANTKGTILAVFFVPLFFILVRGSTKPVAAAPVAAKKPAPEPAAEPSTTKSPHE